jgi:serine/threonine protein kinase
LTAWRYSRSPQSDVAERSAGLVGTADYLSPEQAQDPDQVDIRGDLYSLGCTFYFLLTGRPPFPQGNLPQKLMAHKSATPKPVEEFRGDVPAEVSRILSRLMAKDPGQRFQTPAALALALQPFTRLEVATAPPAPLAHRPVAGRRRDDTPLPGALKRASGPFGALDASRQENATEKDAR